MLAFAHRLAPCLGWGVCVYLSGPLGAGKSCLARGVAQGLGYHDRVKSPSYTFIEPYTLPAGRLIHMDLYRIHDQDALVSLGIEDYFVADTLCLIEWPENGQGLLPAADVLITIAYQDPGRRVQLSAQTPRGEAIIKKFKG
jgi:tRNA threonylcarbamoyladenosine biosynthesis protein TsaE